MRRAIRAGLAVLALGLPLLLAAWGGLLCAGAAKTPPYVGTGVPELFWAVPEPGESREAFRQRWGDGMERLRSDKWEKQDMGRGLLFLGGVLLAGVLRFRLWRPGSWAEARTPGSRRGFLFLLAAAWLALVPALWFRVLEDMERGYYHHQSDSIGAVLIPDTALLLLALPLLLAAAGLALRHARLPAGLWARDAARPVRGAALALACGGTAALLAAAAVDDARHGGFLAVPSLLAGAYLLLSLRAALAAPPLSAAAAPSPRSVPRPA
ncbi:MAG TPA: hypothetical protein VEB20_06345 [Azospirillaceae bacterium]|nr:hypothetical protein [Azospirillaceae bacterium]